jgi:hypothetical protein
MFPALRGGFRGKAIRGLCGEWRLDPSNPVEADLLPEGEVPELFVNGVGNVRDNMVNEFLVEAFDDVGGGRGCAAARECLREFVHGRHTFKFGANAIRRDVSFFRPIADKGFFNTGQGDFTGYEPSELMV